MLVKIILHNNAGDETVTFSVSGFYPPGAVMITMTRFNECEINIEVLRSIFNLLSLANRINEKEV